MTFALASNLFWMVPIGAAILALYLLKMKRRDLRVPATFLWPPVVDEIRANSLFQKLRFNWLLVLQLLAAAALVLALARPLVQQKGLGGSSAVLIVDASASMSATDVAPNRFERARLAARNVIDGMRPGDRACVIEAGPTPRVACPLSEDPAKLSAALDGLQPTDAESDMGSALRLAASLASAREGARILVFSDGAFPEVRDYSPGKAQTVFRQFGTQDDNLSFSALGSTDTARGRSVFFSVKNNGSKPKLATVTLKLDGKVFESVRIEAAPEQTVGRTLAAPLDGEVIEAEMDCEDLLKSDNYAATLANPGGTIRVLLVGPGDFFIERALSLDPRVTLDRASAVPAGADYDVVVFDGVPEKDVQAKGVLTFGAAGPSSPVRRVGTSPKPTYLTSNARHPINAYVDWKPIYVAKMEKVAEKPEGEVLVESRGGPWLVASEGRVKRVYLAFRPSESDFPLQVGFPIFLANAMEFLAPPESASDSWCVPTGRPLSIPANTEGDLLTLTAPDGRKTELSPFGGAFSLRQIVRSGRYAIRHEERDRAVFASLKSATESQIRPAAKLVLGEATINASQSSVRMADFWRPVLLTALLLLAFEWWVFARRS